MKCGISRTTATGIPTAQIARRCRRVPWDSACARRRRTRRQARSSNTATGSSATDTQLTQEKWAESTRWMPWEMMPRPNSPAASSTRVWKPSGRWRVAIHPTIGTKSTVAIMKKNQMNSCWDVERWGSGHFGGWIAPDRWRNPSRWSHGGGIGSRRPPRRYTTGSSTMPLNVLYAPRGEELDQVERQADAEPGEVAHAERRPAPAVAASAPRPTATTRSSRKSSAAALTSPPQKANRSAGGADAGRRVRAGGARRA